MRKMNRFLNYTTQVDPQKTVAEIQALLVGAGARHVRIEYDGVGIPVALTFGVTLGEKSLEFRMAANFDGVLRAMRSSKVPLRYLNFAQARRVAWRVLKDWTEVQLALVAVGQAQMAEVFFPHALDSTGRSFFEAFEERFLKQLPPAEESQG